MPSGVTEGVRWVRPHCPRQITCPCFCFPNFNFYPSVKLLRIYFVPCCRRILLRVHFNKSVHKELNQEFITNHAKKQLINRDVNRGILILPRSSLNFSPDQQIWSLILFGELVTFKMREQGLLYSLLSILYFLWFTIRKKVHLQWWLSLYIYSFFNLCHDVLVLLIKRNSLLLTYILLVYVCLVNITC